MKLLTPSQARELDKISMGEMGISGETLMGNAGKSVANFALELLSHISKPSILILCGKGNNGGDGFAAGSILFDKKYDVSIHSICDKNDLTGDSLIYYLKCESNGQTITFGHSTPEIDTPDLVIDCIFGTGFKGPLRDRYIPLFEWINQLNTTILSVDIASGIDGDSGCVSPIAIKADYTITIERLKVGSIFRHGPDYTGKTNVVDIGFPDVQLSGLDWETVSPQLIKKVLSPPSVDSHKSTSGKVLIIAGSQGMTGAAILCTYGALRSGAGLTVTTAPSILNEIYEKSIVEGMTLTLESDIGILTHKHFEKILEKGNWADAVVLGPGLGRDIETQKLVISLVHQLEKPIILDADGLFPFKENIQLLNERQFPLIITPHIGELSHITGIEPDTIIQNFPSVMTDFMGDFSHTALIKQVPSCIFSKKSVFVNSTGNPGLATGGTGDVLSGMIASFSAQKMNLETAGIVGAYIHGKASDRLINTKGYRGQIASDLLKEIPEVISSYETA